MQITIHSAVLPLLFRTCAYPCHLCVCVWRIRCAYMLPLPNNPRILPRRYSFFLDFNPNQVRVCMTYIKSGSTCRDAQIRPETETYLREIEILLPLNLWSGGCDLRTWRETIYIYDFYLVWDRYALMQLRLRQRNGVPELLIRLDTCGIFQAFHPYPVTLH